MAITRLLTSDSKTVMGVVTLGLLTWAHYVAMVMEDGGAWVEEDGGVVEGEEGVPEIQRTEGEGEKEQEGVRVVQQTEAWREKTANNLRLLIERMCVLVTSPVWRVRLCLVGWAHSLLAHCSM